MICATSFMFCVVFMVGSSDATPLPSSYEDSIDKFSDGYNPAYLDGADYESAAKYDDSRFYKDGARGDRGYKTLDNFQKGLTGQFGANGERNDYSDKAGRNSGHDDRSNYYKGKHAFVKGSKGGDFAVSDSYNKGSKTTGFHNVHHKEEYKKNRQFYDVSSKSGHYSRYGDFGAALLAAAGGAANGKKYDQGYRDARYGQKGFADKGSLYDNLKEYAAANGYDGFYNDKSGYRNRGGAERAKIADYYH